MLEDLRRMDVRGYTEVTMDRKHWRRLMLESKDLSSAVVLKKNIFSRILILYTYNLYTLV